MPALPGVRARPSHAPPSRGTQAEAVGKRPPRACGRGLCGHPGQTHSLAGTGEGMRSLRCGLPPRVSDSSGVIFLPAAQVDLALTCWEAPTHTVASAFSAPETETYVVQASLLFFRQWEPTHSYPHRRRTNCVYFSTVSFLSFWKAYSCRLRGMTGPAMETLFSMSSPPPPPHPQITRCLRQVSGLIPPHPHPESGQLAAGWTVCGALQISLPTKGNEIW